MAPSTLVRSTPLRGRKPSNDQRGPVTPAATTAARSADAPGIGITRIPAVTAAATSVPPGSLISGVPASLISATAVPDCSRAMIGATRSASSKPGRAVTSVCTPMLARSGRETRVSSATISPTSRSTAAARGVRSARLPIGVETICNAPGVAPPPRRSSVKLRAPPRVEIVTPTAPPPHLCDWRHLALELRSTNHLAHP